MDWLGCKRMGSPGKLKFISYFQKAPGPSQAWDNIIRADQELHLKLALFVCAFPFLGNHVALASEASRHADSKCKFQAGAWVQQHSNRSSREQLNCPKGDWDCWCRTSGTEWAYVVALMKVRLDFFHGGTKGNETLGTQGAAIESYHATTPHGWVSQNALLEVLSKNTISTNSKSI